MRWFLQHSFFPSSCWIWFLLNIFAELMFFMTSFEIPPWQIKYWFGRSSIDLPWLIWYWFQFSLSSLCCWQCPLWAYDFCAALTVGHCEVAAQFTPCCFQQWFCFFAPHPSISAHPPTPIPHPQSSIFSLFLFLCINEICLDGDCSTSSATTGLCITSSLCKCLWLDGVIPLAATVLECVRWWGDGIGWKNDLKKGGVIKRKWEKYWWAAV